jgi:imidazolonepropionase-like amidohydrolase
MNSATCFVDGDVGCLMPGLVEPHGHITFTDVAALKDLGGLGETAARRRHSQRDRCRPHSRPAFAGGFARDYFDGWSG